jgi:hypothetical protein
LLRREYWETQVSKKHLISRVVLLNKDAPKIGEWDKYRPIAISSMVVRFLEALLVEDLRAYGRKRLCPEQFGFVEGVGIEDCRWRLLDFLYKRKRQRTPCYCLFVDFSHAYNSVDRRILD